MSVPEEQHAPSRHARPTPAGRLSDAAREDLARSSLTPETIAAAGIYSASEAEVRALLGFGAGAGLAFPYPKLDGPTLAEVEAALDLVGWRWPPGLSFWIDCLVAIEEGAA